MMVAARRGSTAASHRSVAWRAGVFAFVMSAAACGGGTDTTPSSDPATVSTQSNDATTVPSEAPPASTSPAQSLPESPEPTSSPASEPASEPTTPATGGFDVANLPEPDGAPMRVGFVNTEGTPGLDFPDIRNTVSSAADYLNQHGGFGNRPIELITCLTNGSPERSQACAQELAGKDVELVLLGLDLFPDYATYTAANLPVIGVLPILPGDYSADALFLTGGNATLMAAIASVASTHFNARTVAIIGADNPGANSSAASLTAALDVAGIAHTTVKGGDNETDAGFQGLMREASKDNPDVMVSLYSDAGCIGTMRARASLGVTIPVITTGICAGKAVLDEVGDDAVGWMFSGVSTAEDTPTSDVLHTIVAPVLGVEPDEVDSSSLGLGALGLFSIMSVAQYSHQLAGAGVEVTGQAVYDLLLESDGLSLWGSSAPIDCGAAPKYPTICSFIFPFAEYVAGGEVVTVPGLERVDSREYLP